MSHHPLQNLLIHPKKEKNVRNGVEIEKNKKRKNSERRRGKRRKDVNVDGNQRKENKVSKQPRGLYQILIFLILTSFLLMLKRNSKDKEL